MRTNHDTDPDIDFTDSIRGQLASTSRARVLLAEDDREMRDMVATRLRQDGYDVVVANDGGELLVQLATAYVSENPSDAYDLIVSDIRMPVCTGLQVLEGIRRAQWSTPIILMTAFGDEATRIRVEKQNGVLFDKPFDLDDLRTAVLYLLRSQADQEATTPKSLTGSEPILALVATTDSGIDAWSIKWTLQADGIHAYLGGRAMSSNAESIDVYVLQRDAVRAHEVIARLTRKQLTNTVD